MENGDKQPPPRPERRPPSSPEAVDSAAVIKGKHNGASKGDAAANRSPRGQEEPEEQRDMHGFKIVGEDYISTYKTWIPLHQKKLAERKAKWLDLFRKHPGSSYLDSKELKKLVRKGIPDSSRGEVWMDISGASKLLSANPGAYKKLVETAKTGCAPDAVTQIELDLPRTFPDHIHFRGEIETPIVKSLRNLLMAYANRNKVVGYCQGMNFIAGIMLLFLKEEHAFWLLCALLEYILPADYYAQDLSGCNVDLRVFKSMLSKRHPKLMKRCEEAGLGVEFFGLEWFIAIFSKTFPIETTLRVWDCIFNEGDKIVFRVGLGMLEQYEKKLLAIKEPHELFQAVQALGRAELDADLLLKVGFAVHMKRSQVEDLRKMYRVEVRNERQARLAKSR